MRFSFIALVPALLASSLGATTITVTNASDVVANGDGCSLREAILNANANNQSGSTDCAAGSGADVIQFAIGMGAQTIFPLSELPAITNALTIDATTQPLYAGAPLIELNGSMTTMSNGLTLSAPNCVVRGLVIRSFAYAGIWSTSTGATIAGNYIGTDSTGTAGFQNGTGVVLGGSGSVVGGSTAADRNLISGNDFYGIDVTSGPNVVKGNYIGTNAAGTAAVGNKINGIVVDSGTDGVTIGGLAAGEGNLISGNWAQGMIVGGTTNLRVWGNKFGSDAAGTTPIANGSEDIFIQGTNNANIIGGTGAGTSNLFMFPGFGVFAAISLLSTTDVSNAILQNQFLQNPPGVSLGIDLGRNGVTPNDAGDGDTGPNNLQNFPVVTLAAVNGGNLTLEATLGSTPNTMFAIDFYLVASPGRFGEMPLASVVVTTDASGSATASTSIPFVPPGSQFITALATLKPTVASFSDTSEFSAPLQISLCTTDAQGPTVTPPSPATAVQTLCM